MADGRKIPVATPLREEVCPEKSWLGRTAVRRNASWVLISVLALVLGPHRASAQDALRNLFGSHMNDVAVRVAQLPGKYSHVYSASLAFSPDGRLLADQAEAESTPPVGEVVHVWEWRERRMLKTLLEPLGATRSNRWNSLVFVPGFLAMCVGSGGKERTVVRVWNTKDWGVAADLNNLPGECTAVGMAGGGKLLVYAMNKMPTDSELVAYAVGTWEERWRLTPGIHPDAMAISPDGSLAAVTGRKIVVTETPSDPRQPRSVDFERHLVVVDLRQPRVVRDIRVSVGGCVAWSSDGARILMTDAAVSAATGASLYQLPLDARVIARGILSDPLGRYLIEYQWNGRGEGFGVKIWDAGREHLLQHLQVGDAGATAISADGKYLAVGQAGQTTVWQLK